MYTLVDKGLLNIFTKHECTCTFTSNQQRPCYRLNHSKLEREYFVIGHCHGNQSFIGKLSATRGAWVIIG